MFDDSHLFAVVPAPKAEFPWAEVGRAFVYASVGAGLYALAVLVWVVLPA